MFLKLVLDNWTIGFGHTVQLSKMSNCQPCASTVRDESFDETIAGAKPLGEQDSDNDWTKKDDEYDTQYSLYNTSNQRGRDHFAKHKEEGKETKQEHPVAMDIL